MSGLGIKQQWHTIHGSKSSKQVQRIIKFKEEKNPSKPLFTEAKILNLTNIITLNYCILVLDHLNSSLPAIFNDLFKRFKKQHIHNSRGGRRYVLNIPKMKNFFHVSRSVQVKLIEVWDNLIVKVQFTTKDLWNALRLSKKNINK